MANTKPLASQIKYGRNNSSNIDVVLKKSVLVYETKADAAAAAVFLPDGQKLNCPNDDGLLSEYSVQSGILDFKRNLNPEVSMDLFANGSGTDETLQVQKALNASIGRILVLGSNRTYGVTNITIPSDVTIVSNGSIFRKITPSATAGITVQSNFKADVLSLSTPGSSVDRGIRFVGNSVDVGRVISVSDSQDSQYGVHFQSTDGTPLENIFVKSTKVSNFKTGCLIFNVGKSSFDNFDITSYIVGVYLRDVYSTNFNGAIIRTKSPSATGDAGQNGLLVESTISSSSTNALRFSNWDVLDAPEHGYRFGGGYTIQDVWMSNCRSTASGSGGSSATGGSGFKVLGATNTVGERHRDFFFENCIVEDVSTTGNGLNNFAGFHMGVVDNLHISNCSVRSKLNTYSSQHGYLFQSVTDVFITNSSATDCRLHGILLLPATLAGFPGVLGDISNVQVIGGNFQVPSTATSAVIRMQGDGAPSLGTVSNMRMTGVLLSGGAAAIRTEPGIGFSSNYFDFEYTNPGTTIGAPPLQFAESGIRINFRGLYYGTYAILADSGSYHLDTTTGVMRMRQNNNWIIVSDVAHGTWSPTVSAVTNLEAVSLVDVCQYVRMGNIVTVSGTLLLDPVAGGSVSARVTLPISSNFSNFAQCSGVASSADGTFDGIVNADATNKTLAVTCNATVTSARNVSFNATYRVV